MNFKEYQKYGISQSQFEQIRQYFLVLNPNKQGKIRPQDIKTFFECMGEEIKNSAVYQQICTLCSKGKEQITFEQFLPFMTSKIFKSKPTLHASELLQFLDNEKRGSITIQTLRKTVQQLNFQIDEQTLQQMFKLGDQNKDSMINLEQLQNLLYLMREKKK